MSRLVFLMRAVSISATLFLPAASCAQQASDMETSSAANEIVFPDGTVIDVDIPMEMASLLEEIEEMGGSHRTVSKGGAPRIDGLDADQVYKISTNYDAEERVQRQYFAYVVEGQIVHLEAQFNRPAQP